MEKNQKTLNFSLVARKTRQRKKINQIIMKKEKENDAEYEIFDLLKRSKMEQIALFNREF